MKTQTTITTIHPKQLGWSWANAMKDAHYFFNNSDLVLKSVVISGIGNGMDECVVVVDVSNDTKGKINPHGKVLKVVLKDENWYLED